MFFDLKAIKGYFSELKKSSFSKCSSLVSFSVKTEPDLMVTLSEKELLLGLAFSSIAKLLNLPFVSLKPSISKLISEDVISNF